MVIRNAIPQMKSEEAHDLIKRRRLQILVHSAIYYRLNESIISDHTYDAWSKELAELQKQYPNEAKQAPYAEAFAEFDGSTGFDLPTSDPWVVNKAQQLLAYHKKEVLQHGNQTT